MKHFLAHETILSYHVSKKECYDRKRVHLIVLHLDVRREK